MKKDGKTFRIVHSLEPLNAVTIAHSGLPPAMESLAEHFAGRACGGILDLYVGYDERTTCRSVARHDDVPDSVRRAQTRHAPYGMDQFGANLSRGCYIYS